MTTITITPEQAAALLAITAQLQPQPATAASPTPAVPKQPGYVVPPQLAKQPGFAPALSAWIEARRRKRNPATGYAVQLFLNRLEERPQEAVEALNVAIERGWATMKWEWFDRMREEDGQGEARMFLNR